MCISNIQQKMLSLERHIVCLKKIKELSSIKRRKYSYSEISEYQNGISANKLEGNGVSEINKKKKKFTD